ncbi:MAG: FkbM family methyltransferase [Thiobacillus sp.]
MSFHQIKFVPNEKHQAFVSDFLNPEGTKKKYIMGMSRDGYALDVCQLVEIDGFLDDFSSIGSYAGKPIFTSEQISKDSMILVCSTVRTVTANNALKARGFENVLDYPSFFLHANHAKLHLRIFDGFAKEFETNRDQFEWVCNLLCDTKSKAIFNTLVEYRMTADIEIMADYSYIPNEQYFPDFLELDEEVFMDIGGYDGQTSLELIKRCANYAAIYLFEPSESNLVKAKNNLSDFSNIHFINRGLSDKPAELKFNSNEGSASRISDAGDVTIYVDALDNLVTEKTTFLKMDIEGAESLAIEGAKRHILNDHPKMAIAVYHKPDDFWRIPKQILSIRDDYDLHLRHYTEGTDETVMYFVPHKSER